jgi:hypothetical protein
VLQEGTLYRFGQDNKFCQVLQLEKMPTIFQELHGVVGRHFSFNIIMGKFLDVGYWWSMMNQNVYEYYQTYDQCQKTSNMLTQNLAKLLLCYPKNHFKNEDWILLDLLNLQAKC